MINENILRLSRKEYITLKDSTLKSRTKIFKMKMITKLQTSSKGFLGWCFHMESHGILRANTTGVDVAHVTHVMQIDMCVTP